MGRVILRFLAVITIVAAAALWFRGAPARQHAATLTAIEAARRGRVEDTLRALDSGANVNGGDAYGRTPLMWAVQGANKDLVAKLILRGADVNRRDLDGRTPLMWAAMARRRDAVLLLLDRGANVAITDQDGTTALMVAAQTG